MNTPQTIADLTDLGRVRLSKHFFMREMLYTEVGNFCGVPNFPKDPDLAVAAGRRFCEEILEPLKAAFGHVSIRSAFRSSVLNGYGHELLKKGDLSAACAPNDFNRSRHAWDERDAAGMMGACASVVIPGYIDYFERTGDWKAMAWWIRDHVPAHDEIFFFRNLGAFNIRWYEGESEKPICFLSKFSATDMEMDMLTRKGDANFEGDHSAEYAEAMRFMKR